MVLIGVRIKDRRFWQAWLALGFLWFLLGITWAPSNKIYHQGLALLFWLPAIFQAWLFRERLKTLWRVEPILILGLLLLFGWAALGGGAADEPVREIKYIFYVLFFLIGIFFLADFSLPTIRWSLQLAGFGMALAAFASLLIHYGIEGKAWRWRLQGIGGLDHPIIGGYIIGLVAVWWYCLPPRKAWVQALRAAGLLTLLAFMLMTQSRGVWVALLGTIMLMRLWHRGQAFWWVSGGLLVAGVIGGWQFESIVMARGVSYRPEILSASLQMIAERPWMGVGLGVDYKIIGESGLVFDHTHNIFTHVAVELGMPGLLLWVLIWVRCGVIGWQQRGTALGATLLSMLFFSTLALLFDGANLWDSPRPEWFLTWLPVGLALGIRMKGHATHAETAALQQLHPCEKESTLSKGVCQE